MNDYVEQRLINVLTIDIETIPSGEKLSIEEMKQEAPKNYKNEETILKWAEENVDEEYKKRSLNSLKGRLLCVSMKWNDEPSKIIPYNEDESVMVKQFGDNLAAIGKNIYSCAIVGHNIGKFDRLWLMQRGFKYGNKDILALMPSGKLDKRLVDTNDLFNCGMYGMYTKLKDMCEFLGVPTPKDDIDGSEVYDTFLKGELDRIYEYCKKDTDATYQCYLKMQP